ncbi:MAG TPA: integrase core domain-containing protein [Baekduia sp.]|nr:integrase core domain-containing protein [Baekduia sp.]
MQDRRCRFGLAARIEMVRRRQAGESFRQIARAMACSPTTVKTQCDRWAEASAQARADFSCLLPRRPVPRSCPWALSAEVQAEILDARAKTGWGEMRLPVLCGGRHRSSIGKVLRRAGVYDRPKQPRPASRSYEWTQAGALLHIDALRLSKFDRPGHWATGDRRQRDRSSKRDTVVIGVIDDYTRLVYCELHGAENADTVTATLARAIPWFIEQGCGPVQAVMSDNAMAYTRSAAFAALLAQHGARHITPPPYTPRWNGKIERFFQTAKREWSHGRVWQSSRQRDRALSSFVRFYNRQRPHSAAGGRPPITRVH